MTAGLFSFLPLDRVIFGTPAATALQQEVQLRGAKRVFVVTGRTLNQRTELIKQATAGITNHIVGIFDACTEHTPRDSVIALAQALRAANADLIVSIGGGTVIDTVKIALVCLAENLERVEQLDDWHMSVNADGTLRVPVVREPPCRQITVPTTLSGAEFSDLAGGTDTRTGVKHGFTGRFIGSASVILDPAMTLATPDQLWLSTGIRAIDHAVEALCAVNAQPFTDALALRALGLLQTSLRRYMTDPQDQEARLSGQMGAWLAATSIRRVHYGASHGLGHALGADSGVPHGITSCVLLPSVMRYNQAYCVQALKEIAAAFGDASQPAADQLQALIAELKLPTRISQLSVARERLPIIAQKGLANPFVRANPRPITQASETLEILESAW
jgi:alcohol dehydrogenase class IV